MSNIKNIAAQSAYKTAALRTAKLSDFRTPTSKILCGERLSAVTALEASISKSGLLTPLQVTQCGGKLIVIDGKKRLAALRRMRFRGALPPSLANVPFEALQRQVRTISIQTVNETVISRAACPISGLHQDFIYAA